MSPELGLMLSTVALATMVGMTWRHRQGRVRAPADSTAGTGLPKPVLRLVDRSTAVTLLQLNSPFCARCPQARTVLGELAEATDGLGHAQLDLAEHPELAGALKVRSTPTTLVLSRAGEELFRVTGVPRPAELLNALQPHL